MFYQLFNTKKLHQYIFDVDRKEETGNRNSILCQTIFLHDFLKLTDYAFGEQGVHEWEIATGYWLAMQELRKERPYLTPDLVKAEVFATMYYHYQNPPFSKNVEDVFHPNFTKISNKYFGIFFRATEFLTTFTTEQELVKYLSCGLTELLCKKLEDATAIPSDKLQLYQQEIFTYCTEWFGHQLCQQDPVRILDKKYQDVMNKAKSEYKTNAIIAFSIT